MQVAVLPYEDASVDPGIICIALVPYELYADKRTSKIIQDEHRGP